MRVRTRSFIMLSMLGFLGLAMLAACGSPSTTAANASTQPAAAPAAQEKGGQEEFGPYELVANWPQPLPDGDDGVKHDGWTW